jgi:hypothetical protein
MFEPIREFPVKTGAAFLASNLSVYHHKTKGHTFAAYLGKDSVGQRRIKSDMKTLIKSMKNYYQ